jgi:hypothetical protein
MTIHNRPRSEIAMWTKRQNGASHEVCNGTLLCDSVCQDMFMGTISKTTENYNKFRLIGHTLYLCQNQSIGICRTLVSKQKVSKQNT